MKLSGDLKRKVLYSELLHNLKALDPGTEMEVPFSRVMATKRKYRADFLCPKIKLIIEVNGGQFIGGRHNRGGKGYENDITKINMAQLNGFRLIQFTYEMLERGEHLKAIKELMIRQNAENSRR